MSKPHIKYFETGSWPVYFGFTTDRKAFSREMRRMKCQNMDFISGGDATTWEFVKPGQQNTIIVTVRLKRGVSDAMVIGIIAHEATHVWQKINEAMKGTCPGGEHQAYAIQYLTQKMVEEYLAGKK